MPSEPGSSRPPQSPKRTRQLEISLPPGVTYRAGNHIGVCPKNDEERVERLARHLGVALDGLFMAPKTHERPRRAQGRRAPGPKRPDRPGRHHRPPTVPLLDLLMAKAADPAERSEAGRDQGRPGGYRMAPRSALREAVDAGGYDVLRLLAEFPSCSLNIFEFLRVAQPLRPRYYSTSSSPRIHGEAVAHLTVGLQATRCPGLPDRDFRGMSSHYLHTLREGDRLNVFLDGNGGFDLQEDRGQADDLRLGRHRLRADAGFPVGAAGDAAGRASGWARRRCSTASGRAQLDFIYRDEIEEFAAAGVLDHVHIVDVTRASRTTATTSRTASGSRARWSGACSPRAATFTCAARSRCATAVHDAFVDVAADHGPLPREHAEAYLAELETTARYRPDLWTDLREPAWTYWPSS